MARNIKITDVGSVMSHNLVEVLVVWMNMLCPVRRFCRWRQQVPPNL